MHVVVVNGLTVEEWVQLDTNLWRCLGGTNTERKGQHLSSFQLQTILEQVIENGGKVTTVKNGYSWEMVIVDGEPDWIMQDEIKKH